MRGDCDQTFITFATCCCEVAASHNFDHNLRYSKCLLLFFITIYYYYLHTIQYNTIRYNTLLLNAFPLFHCITISILGCLGANKVFVMYFIALYCIIFYIDDFFHEQSSACLALSLPWHYLFTRVWHEIH